MIASDVIYEMLMETGMRPSTKGFEFWELAIAHRVNGYRRGMCELYTKIAGETHSASRGSVERAMRCSVDRALAEASDSLYNWCYVSPETGSVTNKDFLELAAREAKKRLR
nr:MAG TPA: Sporulation initiation factor Spo0A C terminal [Caudoviricetes sp.]